MPLHPFIMLRHHFHIILHHAIDGYNLQRTMDRQLIWCSRYLKEDKVFINVLGPDILYNQSNLIPACLPTPDPSSPNFASRFHAGIVTLAETNNVHGHSNACYK